jgi:hypothetical protein
MSEDTSAPAGAEVTTLALPADAPASFEGVDAARDYLASLAEKRKNPPAERADPATSATELSPEDNADPLEAAPGEDEDADPEAERPEPIARPKSWTEAEEAEWQATPRALQEKIVARELDRDNALRRAQNEAAEKLKGLTAKEQQAEEARQKYEAKLPEVMQTLVEVNNRDYADIKSQADIDTLVRAMNSYALTDPVQAQQINAYLTGWQMHQQKMAATKQELDQTNARKADETRKEALDRKTRENSLLIEKAPEFADPKKLAAAQSEAVQMFRDKGFSEDELAKLDVPLLDDHRMQLIIADALKYRAIVAAKAEIPGKAAKSVPPVLRPGVSRQSGESNSARIQALDSKLNNSGSIDDAFALLQAKRSAAARRAS